MFADSHLGQVEGDADDLLASLESVRQRGFSAAVLLGDIFHYFIGHPKLETPFLTTHSRRLRGGRRARASAALRRGEPRFFRRRDAVRRPVRGLRADGRARRRGRHVRVRARRPGEHGRPPVPLLAHDLEEPRRARGARGDPRPLARAIVAKTEARLYRSNFRHKKKLPEEALRAEGRRARAQGYDALLVGHFHVGRTFAGPDGVTHVLPAWLEERKHAEIAPDGRLSIVEEPTAERARRRGFGALEADPASAPR